MGAGPRLSAELFVDSSAWYPLANSRDRHHARLAEALRAQLRRARQIVTTNLMLAETHGLLLRLVHRDAALAFLTEARRPPHVVVTSTADLEARAEREWLRHYADHDFSLADAVSFVVMAERGIREALTLDRHFAAAGFVMVPADG